MSNLNIQVIIHKRNIRSTNRSKRNKEICLERAQNRSSPVNIRTKIQEYHKRVL